MSAKIKIITAIYVFIIAGIVVLADYKGTAYLLNFVGKIPYGDKLGHFFLMGIFSFLVNLVLQTKEVKVWKMRYLLGSLIVLIIVTIEEFSQIFVSGRSFDYDDLVFDCLGIFVFGELARFIYRRYLIK
ncbi:MAG: VanZ family protein [Aridibacter sp.]|jgi:VanZ family protein|nr:VanZ family protein [Acidobacteriota bacterium]